MSIKNIIVFGAHGKVGQHVIKLAGSRGIVSTAVVRNAAQENTVAALATLVKTSQLTLDSASVKELTSLIKGHEAVVVSVGSRGQNLLQVDLDGVVKLFEASVAALVRRLVLVSAIKAEDRDFIDKSLIRNYYIAKHYADRILQHEFKEKLDFTIVKPGLLSDNEPTGKILLVKGEIPEKADVSRADVAQFILETLDSKALYGKSYDFVNGSDAIKEALA